MSVRVQVILEEDEAARFRSQAMKESKSLSAWLRDAGRKMLETDQQRQPLTDPSALKRFFRKCSEREKGTEPDWEEHKRLLLEGRQAGDILILYHADYFHLSKTFRASERIHFSGSSPGQAPIFWISLARFFEKSQKGPFSAKLERISFFPPHS